MSSSDYSDIEDLIPGNVFSAKEENLRKTPSKYPCSIENCGQLFSRQRDLERHEYKHTGVKKYVCSLPDCGKRYIIKAHLERHKECSHESSRPEKNLKCPAPSCDKMFAYPHLLAKHFKNSHENAKVYTCPVCQRKFARKIGLRKHVISHSGDYPFKCLTCSRGFVSHALFKRHICKVKVRKCDICDEQFANWSLLVMHKRLKHAGKFKCEICSKVYVRKYYLKRHLRKAHSTHPNEDVDMHKCPFDGCDKVYYYRNNLNAHIRSIHEGNKFKCTLEGCSKELSSKKKLQNHIRTHNTELKEATNKTVARRKDSGKKKRSTASLLSGISCEPKIEDLLLKGKGGDIVLEIENKEIPSEDSLSIPTNPDQMEICTSFHPAEVEPVINSKYAREKVVLVLQTS